MRGIRSTKLSQCPWSKRSDVDGIQHRKGRTHKGLPGANNLSWAQAVSLREWDFATWESCIWYLIADQVHLHGGLGSLGPRDCVIVP